MGSVNKTNISEEAKEAQRELDDQALIRRNVVKLFEAIPGTTSEELERAFYTVIRMPMMAAYVAAAEQLAVAESMAELGTFPDKDVDEVIDFLSSVKKHWQDEINDHIEAQAAAQAAYEMQEEESELTE